MSISVETRALNWGLDGETTKINIRVTDTAGNPVPDGTAVQFSAQGGQIETSCRLTGVKEGTATISACSVTFATQNPRPPGGYVTILAWLEGDEAFIDANGNGVYDTGEAFFDTGRIYRDDNQTGLYEAGVDELNVGATLASSPGLGTSACGAKGTTTAIPQQPFINLGMSQPLSVDGTCDGVWGRTLVRTDTLLPISDARRLAIRQVAGGVEVFTSGTTGPFAPAAPGGTAVTVVSAPTGCTLTVSPPTVPNNAVVATTHKLVPSTSGTCASGAVTVKAKFNDNEAVVTANLPL